MSGYTLYPAIDVRDGRVVRLRQGDYAQETRYDDAPLTLAQRYASEGAGWLHLVDLDAARQGGYTLKPLLASLNANTAQGAQRLQIQTGGGVRSEDDLANVLEAGADRVVIGSLAVREPTQVIGWLRRYGAERITVALDARQDVGGRWRLASAGWTHEDGAELQPLLERYAGAGLKHLLCTDIARDGMLSGPNISLYQSLHQLAPALQIQASGGVRDIADITAAREAGCTGAVLGKGLLDGKFTLMDALREQRPC